jgi:dihydropyrimidinase
MMKDLLIQHGTIITSEKTFLSDILVSGGKIFSIGENLSHNKDTEIIDASGKYIFPGAIDPHVHFDLPTPAGPSSDNFETGSIAGIYGGTTSFIDFVTPRKKESLITALESRLKDAENSKSDFGFHMSITSWSKNIAKEMEICVKQYGITSFKCYMAYKGVIGIEEDELFEVMKKAASLQALVTVHCEIGDEIIRLQKMFLSDGENSPEYHALSRPSAVEAESVKHVIALAQRANCPVYIVHTSAKESVEIITNAQQKGQSVFSETCPQYLLLDDSVYKLPLPESMKYVISPPMRKEEDQKALWEGLKNNSIQTIATDHCPFNLIGQKDVGLHNFARIPNGAGGIEHRLALLYTFGVLKKKISLNKFVALTSTNAAKIFGLYPQKGEIAIGSDADLLIWNPETENIISSKTHHQHCDSNIFEGFKTTGSAEYVITKGNLVLSNGECIAEHINGNYLFRKTS